MAYATDPTNPYEDNPGAATTELSDGSGLCATHDDQFIVGAGGIVDEEGEPWVAAGDVTLESFGLTASAAEIDVLHNVTAGTAAASSGAVLGANKNLDTLVIADGGFKLGSGAGTAVNATAAEINYAADVSANTQALTASGAVAATTKYLELNHGTVAIAATIATAVAHQGLFTVKNTSASGTASHTVTLTTGTWNGTNKIATFAVAASLQCLVVVFDSAGNGTVVNNTGTVVLSG